MNEVFARYGATNPRRFDSVAPGDSSEVRDIDLMVDLNPSARNAVMHGAGMSRSAYFHVNFGLILDILDCLETPPTDSGVWPVEPQAAARCLLPAPETCASFAQRRSITRSVLFGQRRVTKALRRPG